MKVTVYQLNGCEKCFNNTILLEKMDVNWATSKDPIAEGVEIAILTGYATMEDEAFLQKLRSSVGKIYLYGTCATHGGIFGLANQKGANITPVSNIIAVDGSVSGCLASVTELSCLIDAECAHPKGKLCVECSRKASCEFLEEVVHQVDLSEVEADKCFNDMGYVCSGMIAKNCAEKCMDFGTPCRGCDPLIDRSDIRMLGMFGTIMGQIDVATEASEGGATDKLADKDDEISASFTDLVGTFFRFTLASSAISRGKIPSSGDLISDVFIGRPLEELPLIIGAMGGNNFISRTIDVLSAYENGANITPSADTVELRKQLLAIEPEYISASNDKKVAEYQIAVDKIRKIAGNMNLSNLYFGGFKVALGKEDFEKLAAKPIEIKAGDYSSGKISYTISDNGVIKTWEEK